MICLDTNYLIQSLVQDSHEADRLLAWSGTGERFIVPAVVWYEFLCGPVKVEHVSAIRSLTDEIVQFDEDQAEQAARLFNATGRARQRRVDAMIAACALSREVPLATGNKSDFAPFIQHGLRLLP